MMEKLLLITDALEYIETHLTEELRTDDLANHLHCSKSSAEKLFRYVTHMSIKDYCIRRRMSCAAKDIRKDPDLSLLDLALKYDYGSNEAFTRAFRNIWYTTPSEYRRNPAGFDLFPPLRLEQEIMEDETMSEKKKVDISELYDVIKTRTNCYIVGVDIKCLVPINEISHEAGDIAILTALKRLENASGAEDIVFRIGGDEFVSITASEDRAYAENMVSEILSHNGETFSWANREIPLALYATCYRLEKKNLRYSEMFRTMQEQLDMNKNA